MWLMGRPWLFIARLYVVGDYVGGDYMQTYTMLSCCFSQIREIVARTVKCIVHVIKPIYLNRIYFKRMNFNEKICSWWQLIRFWCVGHKLFVGFCYAIEETIIWFIIERTWVEHVLHIKPRKALQWFECVVLCVYTVHACSFNYIYIYILDYYSTDRID